MKNLTLIIALFFGWTGAVNAQVNLDDEMMKGSTLRISEGMTLVYGADYFGKKFDIVFKIKSLNHQVVFEYEMLNENNNKGTLTMTKEALEMARAQDNYYHEGGDRLLEYATSIWVSKLVFNDLISNGEVTISTDGGASQVKLQGAIVGHDFKFFDATENEEADDLSYVYAQSEDGKVKYWISLNKYNPIILKMEMGWSIWLKEIR